MRFRLDESTDVRVAHYLSSLGDEVKVVAWDYQQALPDHQVLSLAYQEQRILLTNDTDFGELIFVLVQPFFGVILFRLGSLELAPLVSRLSYVLEHHSDQLQQFLVVTPQRVR